MKKGLKVPRDNNNNSRSNFIDAQREMAQPLLINARVKHLQRLSSPLFSNFPFFFSNFSDHAI